MGIVTEPGLELLQPNPSERSTTERVLWLRHWTPTLLSFRITRPRGFRFTPGHYARLGLDDGIDVDTVWRPYSLVSASYDEYLEFIAVLVPGGAFSERLARLRVGAEIRLDKGSFGFLTRDQLAPGRDLWLLATGSGIGPFISILRDPATWQSFARLILVHGVRHSAELAYRAEISSLPQQDLLAGAGAQLHYLPAVTREPGASELTQRIPQLLADGRLERAAGVPLTVADSRLMICGNPDMARELRQLLAALGFATGRRGMAGQMAFEKYW